MEKTILKVKHFVSIAVLLCVVFFIVSFFHNNKIVAITEDNKIHYNDGTYIESFEVFDFDKNRCLGSVKFSENGSRYKMYSLHEKPEYIYVDMWLDYRLYMRVSDK